MPERRATAEGTEDDRTHAGNGTTDRAAIRRQKETAEQLERLSAATRNLAAAIADTERIAESRAELLRTARAVVGGGMGDHQRNGVVSLTEAGRRSGRHPEVLRRWCIEGRIPAVRIGRTWAISEETVALLVEHRSRARPQLGRRTGT